LKGIVYIRVVTQDRDRGYMLLVGYYPDIVQRTATQITTLSNPTREYLNKFIERARVDYNASEIRDVTAPGIKKQLAKLFGEEIPKAPKVKKPKVEESPAARYVPTEHNRGDLDDEDDEVGVVQDTTTPQR
jgi:hypothetical protein